MARKSLLAGIAIGAGAALGVREAVTRLRRRKDIKRKAGSGLQPEDSRTESYVPNASVERLGGVTGGIWLRQDAGAARQRGNTGTTSRHGGRREVQNTKEFGVSHTQPRTLSNRRAEDCSPEAGNTGRTVSQTESELRRSPQAPTGPIGVAGSPPAPGTVTYTDNPGATPAQGSEAPFLKDET